MEIPLTHNNNTSAAAAVPIGQVRLLGRKEQWLVVAPRTDPAAHAFHPFVLPRPPESLVSWLVTGGERVWRRRQRCLAALLVSTGSGRWTLRLPRQRCGPDAACWTASADDLPGLPADLRLAGSYQTRVLGPGGPAADTVPQVDGLHLVQALDPTAGRGPLWAFVRAERLTREVRPDRVIVNEFAEAIDEAAPRLRLA
jgi:hypothetical protein